MTTTHYIFIGLPKKFQMALLADADPTTLIDRIFETACRTWGLTIDDITSKSRKRTYAQARHFCAYQLKERTSLSLNQIARKTNLGDHSSVLHGWRRVKETTEQNDPLFHDKIQQALTILNR